MLARESLAIAERIENSIAAARRRGARHTLRSFDTICSATRGAGTQASCSTTDRRDGRDRGFNSSNTISLAALCADQVPTYHIETSTAIDPDAHAIHFRPALIKHTESDAWDWLPSGPVRVGVTAGASTPNNKIGDVVARILATRGLTAPV
jgi:4-hydroxy-3-methylbut-2-enyl diphosphate reductase